MPSLEASAHEHDRPTDGAETLRDERNAGDDAGDDADDTEDGNDRFDGLPDVAFVHCPVPLLYGFYTDIIHSELLNVNTAGAAVIKMPDGAMSPSGI